MLDFPSYGHIYILDDTSVSLDLSLEEGGEEGKSIFWIRRLLSRKGLPHTFAIFFPPPPPYHIIIIIFESYHNLEVRDDRDSGGEGGGAMTAAQVSSAVLLGSTTYCCFLCGRGIRSKLSAV